MKTKVVVAVVAVGVVVVNYQPFRPREAFGQDQPRLQPLPLKLTYFVQLCRRHHLYGCRKWF